MTKYARPVAVGDQTRMYDTFNPDAYQPKPAWWTSDEAALDKMFAPNKAAWVAAGSWFVEVRQGVQDGAVYDGSGYMLGSAYRNPDNTDGDGNPLPPPEE